jgi:DNA-nicking Smr family endonuclease
MLDENAPVTNTPPPPPKAESLPLSNSRSTTTTKITTEPTGETYEISRRNAHDYALKRKDCYNKADQANRQGMTGVASYYINQAREQTRLMKDANRVACEHLSRTRLVQFRQTHRLDLHELHSDEALALFKQVEQECTEGNRRTTPKSIEVITGYGKGSVYGGGYGKIRTVILAYIRQRNYK